MAHLPERLQGELTLSGLKATLPGTRRLLKRPMMIMLLGLFVVIFPIIGIPILMLGFFLSSEDAIVEMDALHLTITRGKDVTEIPLESIRKISWEQTSFTAKANKQLTHRGAKLLITTDTMAVEEFTGLLTFENQDGPAAMEYDWLVENVQEWAALAQGAGSPLEIPAELKQLTGKTPELEG